MPRALAVACACACALALARGVDARVGPMVTGDGVDASVGRSMEFGRAPTTTAGDARGAGGTIDAGAIERLSWAPHAEVYRGFLTEAECEHIERLATAELKPSTVVDASTGGDASSEIRTSSGMFLGRAEDDVIETIEARIAAWTHVPESHGEGFQVLRYEKHQEYRAHYDYFHDKFNVKREKGGQRMGTILMYLSDVEEGGETVFPKFEDGTPAGSEASECARNKLAVRPRKGDALFFRSLRHDGVPDTFSEHAGCPVIRGVKFSATKWMHVSPIEDGSNGLLLPPGVCKDLHAACVAWAKSGECEKNKNYMVGRGRSKGNCMRSCGACPEGTHE